MQDHDAQLERLKKALNVESDTAFSQVLDISQGSVSGAKKRKQIPHAWFFQVAEKSNISLDWLFFGHEPMSLEKSGMMATSPAHQASGTACPHCMELYAELVQAQKKVIQIQEQKEALQKENGELKAEIAGLRQRTSLSTEASGESAAAKTA